jgi:hypothetical protein
MEAVYFKNIQKMGITWIKSVAGVIFVSQTLVDVGW